MTVVKEKVQAADDLPAGLLADLLLSLKAESKAGDTVSLDSGKREPLGQELALLPYYPVALVESKPEIILSLASQKQGQQVAADLRRLVSDLDNLK